MKFPCKSINYLYTYTFIVSTAPVYNKTNNILLKNGVMYLFIKKKYLPIRIQLILKSR